MMEHATSTPLGMNTEALELVGKFEDIDLQSAQLIEPASLGPFCAAGDFLNISAPAGIGKTSLGVDLLIGAFHPQRQGLALGGLFAFYPDEPRPLKCAIIDSESTKSRWATSIRRRIQLEGLDEYRGPIIRHITPSKFYLDDSTNRKHNSRMLAEALAEDFREFVLIDTLAMAWRPNNLNDSEWVFDGIAPFREACHEFGITVVALTHTARPHQGGAGPVGPIGSSFQENQADAQLILSRIGKGKTAGIRLTHRKSRRSFWIQQDTHVDLRFTSKLGYDVVGSWAETWPMNWTDEDNSCSEPQDNRYRIECCVRKAGKNGISSESVANELGIKRRTTCDNLQKLKDAGIVTKIGTAQNTRWRLRS